MTPPGPDSCDQLKVVSVPVKVAVRRSEDAAAGNETVAAEGLMSSTVGASVPGSGVQTRVAPVAACWRLKLP